MFGPLRIFAALLLLSGAAQAADYPAPKQGDYIAHDFRFHDGKVMKELRLHYTTVGDKSGEPVLVLHGTAGSDASMLGAGFAGVLFGPGQPLDASKYYIILPDVIGAGKSSKPSDGMRASFPRYDYDDMIAAQYQLLTQGLGVRHLRLVIGNSMGGMETWLWGEQHPDFMDALVPMASQPSAMASRNWMMRRLIVDSVRRDPEWDGGNYKEQPKLLRYANVWFGIATNGGTLHYAKVAPTTATADKLLDGHLAAPFTADANDFMYQWDASRDYDADPGLGKITAYVLAINSADDERNPPQTGLEERDLKRVKHAQYYLIPASTETRGHGTTAMAKFYAPQLRAFLAAVPKQ
jgi:homoserine O-acetyltransferase